MYVIKDLDQFAVYIRKISLHKFSETNKVVDDEFSSSFLKEKENIKNDDEIISIKEVENIIFSLARENNEEELLLNDKILHNIIEAINERIVTNLLNILANKDIVESAFDEKVNDFVFWIKEENDRSK
jgi:hypothetical protein